MKSFLSVLFFICLGLGKTSFAAPLILSLERQLLDADLVMQGQFLKSSYRKLSDGRIVTSNMFSFERLLGTYDMNFGLERKEIEILVEGGIWQDTRYNSENEVHFFPSEKVILFLKKNKYGLFLSHGTLGKYSLLKDKDGDHYLRSSSFPLDPKIGKISIKEFETKLVKTAFVTESKKKVQEPKELRGPASVLKASIEEGTLGEELSFIGLFFFFILCGVIHQILIARSMKTKSK